LGGLLGGVWISPLVQSVTLPVHAQASMDIGNEFTLTAAQQTSLKANMLYVNIHTAANPGGEIRGQLMV
jgi:hypothetical protein